MKILIVFLAIVGLIVWNIAPDYSMDKRNSKESMERYSKLVYVMHDLKTLQNYKIVNFGRTTYFNNDCSIFCRIEDEVKDSKLPVEIVKELKQGKWNLSSNDDSGIILEREGRKIKLFKDKPKKPGIQEKITYTLIISDIKDEDTKNYYKNIKFLQGLI